MTESAPRLPSDDDLVGLIDSLIVSWDALASVDIRVEDRTTLARFGLAYGLAAHAHRLARVAHPLLTGGRVLEAIPLVRAAYEAALTTVWCVQIQDAPWALANKQIRAHRQLMQTLKQSRDLAKLAASIRDEELILEGGQAIGDDFQSVCDSLEPGGADAYANYRLMSAMSHPTAFLADFYLAEDNTVKPVGVRLRDAPDQPNATPYLAMLSASLVWGGRAIDYLVQGNRRRSELRKAARVLGINPELQARDPDKARHRLR